MSSRIRRPETVRLPLTRGDWLLVKKNLTAGESRGMMRRMMIGGASPTDMDPLLVQPATIATYLVDWSVTDADDCPVVIRGESIELVMSALDMVDMETFQEIWRAISDHTEAVDREREIEKANPFGEPKSYPISQSPASMDGGTNGSPSLTGTYTAS